MRSSPLVSLLLALSLALSLPTSVSAQDDAPPRFDLTARIDEGDRALGPRDVVALAVAHSPRVEVTRFSISAAEAGVRRATALLAPRLELTARYAHVDGFPDGRIGGTTDPAAIAAARALAGTVTDPSARTLFLGIIDGQEAQSAGVTIRIPRDQFGFAARLTLPISDILLAVLPALHGAEARVRAEELRADAARRDVELSALEAYYRYAEARGVLAVAVASRDRVSGRLTMVTAMVEAGVLTPPDRIALEAVIARGDEGVARAEGAVAMSRVALGLATGDATILSGEGAGVRVGAALVPPGAPEGSVDELERRALDERPELLALRQAIAAQRDARTATEAGGYPHLGVYLGGDISNPSSRIIPPRDEFVPVWEVGAVLTWSPNDLATAIFASEEIDAQVARAEAEMLLVEDAVRLELRQAHEAHVAAEAAALAAETSLAAAETAYEARRAQLSLGETVLEELNDTDLRVTEAQLSVLRARLELAMAQARLRHAVGASLVE